jgi:hypothetical protein
MGFFIHGPIRDKETKKMMETICNPHQINPKWVHTIEISGVGEEPRYRIKYYNNDGHFCSIEVQGNVPIEIKPKQKQVKS